MHLRKTLTNGPLRNPSTKHARNRDGVSIALALSVMVHTSMGWEGEAMKRSIKSLLAAF